MAKFSFNNIVQGALGNMSEQSVEDLHKEYEDYLFENEEIQSGYKLIRDAIVFTNLRIIFVDRQGATGKKTSFKSIYLSHIVDVEMETAGAGLDDSEITVTYMKNTLRTSRNEMLDTIKFEFPKQADITPLYKMLGNLVIKNRSEINSIVEK
ncbi:MAG TPA: PH domain-containing protein [Atopostipes sp.]|nr:PH domain-containing protein [Atopostipes sp.]